MTTEERVALLADHAARRVEEGMRLGLGSGSTAEAFVRALGERVADGLIVTGVATSERTALLAHSLAIPLADLNEFDKLDLGFDGADEIDPDLNLVKGRGGALLREKLVARSCRRFVVVATSEKLVEQLGVRLPLPIEVIAFGWRHTASRIAALGLKPKLRADTTGTPFRTDEGNLILDCVPTPIPDVSATDRALKEITGVVDHGLFAGIASEAMIVDEDGGVTAVEKRAG